MDCVSRQSVAAVEFGNSLAQDLLGPSEPFLLVATLGKTFEELLDQRRDRRTALGGDDSGMTIGGIVD